MTQRPLDFVYEKYNNTYNISRDAYKDNSELREKIQTGRGDNEIFKGRHFLYLDNFLAETQPPEVEYDSFSGKNNIYSAAVA